MRSLHNLTMILSKNELRHITYGKGHGWGMPSFPFLFSLEFKYKNKIIFGGGFGVSCFQECSCLDLNSSVILSLYICE